MSLQADNETPWPPLKRAAWTVGGSLTFFATASALTGNQNDPFWCIVAFWIGMGAYLAEAFIRYLRAKKGKASPSERS
jgi:hypothetical protein